VGSDEGGLSRGLVGGGGSWQQLPWLDCWVKFSRARACILRME